MESYKGTSIADIYKSVGPWNYEIKEVQPNKQHKVLYETPPSLISPPRPYTPSKTYHWNDGYVRMPFSEKNLFPSTDDDGKEILIARWELIQKTLLQPIESSRALEAAINAYNYKLPKFPVLHRLFEEIFSEEESECFFVKLLPGIINLALQLPDVLPGSIPLLKAEANKSISLSQLQIASLLANAFLCTFPTRKNCMGFYPGVNFTHLYSASFRPDRDQCVIEKLKCIIHYFRRVLDKVPVGVVTFERQCIPQSRIPRWDRLNNNLGNTRVHLCSNQTIEDGLGLLQVDFANKLIGGGVLGYGCVQEEIRFMICPELLISRLFVEKLGNNEAVIMTGAERYSKYKGYGETFIWDGNYVDETPYDLSGRRKTTIVAIDAIHYNKSEDQFACSRILREVSKAYVGFYSNSTHTLPAVATGNWGCGAFGGDVHLKFLIQLMACSATKRDMVYYTFHDDTLKNVLYDIYTFIATNSLTICKLWRIFSNFPRGNISSIQFLPYIQQTYFDLKNQPSIEHFCKVNKQSAKNLQSPSSRPTADNYKADCPSTSCIKPLSDCDLTEAELCELMEVDMEEPVIAEQPSEVKSPVQNKRKRSISGLDTQSALNTIHGEGKQPEASGKDMGLSFLDCVEEYQREIKSNEATEIDVEELLESLSKDGKSPQKSKTLCNRKITDYFIKS